MKWHWFKQYCVAARMSKALEQRTNLPPPVIKSVKEKVDSLKLLHEEEDSNYLSPKVFTREHDQQLVLWLQRYPNDWDVPLAASFSVFGWGHNHKGQLGGIEGTKVRSPRISNSFAELSPTQIIGGEQTLFAVTKDGKVSTTLVIVQLLICRSSYTFFETIM